MNHEKFTVRYIPIKDCFLHFSENWLKKLGRLSNCAIRITYNTNKLAYFSWSPNPSYQKDDVIGINTFYAHTLGIDEGCLISATIITDIASLSKVSVTPLSSSDWDILELNSYKIQATLLTSLRIVALDQNAVIWAGKHLPIKVSIDSVHSRFTVGQLENFTVVDITPVLSQKYVSKPKTNEHKTVRNYGCEQYLSRMFKRKASNEEVYHDNKLFRALAKYKMNCSTMYLHINLLENFRLDVKNEMVVKQPFIVFIRNEHISKLYPSKDVEDDCLVGKLSKVCCEDSSEEENNVEILVRVCSIESFIENSAYCEDNEVVDELARNNSETVFTNQYVMNSLKISTGSPTALSVCNVDVLNEIKEIQLVSSGVSCSVIINSFKLYVKDHSRKGGLVINTNTNITITGLDYCLVKIFPVTVKYCVLTSDTLAAIKLTAKTDSVETDNTNTDIKKKSDGEVTKSSILIFEKNNALINECLANVNVGLHSKQLCCKFSMLKTNALIIGQAGSGKSILTKIISQKLSQKPYHVNVQFVDCKALKSKKLETVSKHFVQIFNDCAKYESSVIILDDLDVICGKFEEQSNAPGGAELHSNRLSTMLDVLISTYQVCNSLSVIATAKSKEKLNALFTASRGKHIFSSVFHTQIIEKSDRECIIREMFNNLADISNVDIDDCIIKTEGYVIEDVFDLVKKCVFEAYKKLDGITRKTKPVIDKSDFDKVFQNFKALSVHNVNNKQSEHKKWDKIGGLKYAKLVLIETILWPIKYPNLFSKCPIRLQSGILLYGAPGTGKTILAMTAAHEFGVRCISVKGPELLSKYIGASEESVRNIFERAQNSKPCILFFDEFDSLAPRRGHDSTGVTDRVVNQFLTQLDGIETLAGVYVIAATSRPDLIDPALLRPGRFDRQVYCPLPDEQDRLSILEALSKDLNFAQDVNLSEVSKCTNGFTGADLQALFYSAQLSVINDVIGFSISKDVNIEDTFKIRNEKITQKYLMKSLKEIRPSLSNEEKLKYQKIYNRFENYLENSTIDMTTQKVTLA